MRAGLRSQVMHRTLELGVFKADVIVFPTKPVLKGSGLDTFLLMLMNSIHPASSTPPSSSLPHLVSPHSPTVNLPLTAMASALVQTLVIFNLGFVRDS